ncbi:MlaD family protein [Nocardia sp. NPDC049149]|uniref:MlaD family protein n=1 Tax=Nocardia sp. NPDC049149 TaxID=3364315 RepID=UPI0037218D31
MNRVRSNAGPLASLGAIGAILVLGSAYLLFGVVKIDWFAQRLDATMVLADSGGLMPRSKVLLSGIQIGEVTSVTHVGPAVQVAFRITGDYRVPVASSARIEALSAIGEPYLEFRPTAAGGPYLSDGQRIDAATVAAPVSIAEVARTATQLLDQVDPAALAGIVTTFEQALAGTEAMMPPLSRSTDLLAATLLSRTQVIRDMLIAMQSRATDMWWAGPELAKASGPWAEFGPRVDEVAAAVARIVRAENTPSYLTQTDQAIGLVPLLHEIAAKLAVLGPELRTLLPVLQPLVTTTTGAANQLDLGALISQALHATSPDGALTLQITVK